MSTALRSLGYRVPEMLASILLAGAASAAPTCVGDCDLDSVVTPNELRRGVSIGLAPILFDDCPEFDRDESHTVSVDEIVLAVGDAGSDCRPETTPGGTITAAPTPSRTSSVKPTATPTARPTTPATPNFVVRGRILQAGAGGAGVSAAGGAQIDATVDRDDNGQIAGSEAHHTSADTEGSYVLNLAVVAGDRIVVGFHSDDSAPLFRTLDAAPGGDVVVNVTLRTAEDLDCEGARCKLQGDRLTIEGLPAGTSGKAQLFNPVTQSDAFPGDFSDADGRILLSGVFASVELVNQVGQPVTQLAAPATLRMQIPRETWPIVSDTVPGNGRIDVPLYAFDEVAGTWVRDGTAVLENAEGAIIGEGALASIRNGSYGGNVVARGEVRHFSYWNIDWPIDAHACIRGRLLDAGGQPASGATVTVRGLTYVGSSTATTDGDGRFCVDVLRSENAGEDVDQDGVSGETQTVAIRVAYQGHVYDAGTVDVPVQSATCSVGCKDIGEFGLTAESELRPALCSFTAKVRDRSGDPVAGAFVLAADETVDPEVALQLCSDTPQHFCQFSGVTDENGEATLTTVLLDALFIVAQSTTQDGESVLQRWGEATSIRCPTQPVPITLTDGYRQVSLFVEFTPPATIDWTPTTYGVTTVIVGTLEPKWLVAASPPGFGPPLTYGTVPAGALQLVPLGGGVPAALGSGDFISVTLTAPSADGYPIIGQGFAFVP